jgi:hypothetical protein
VRRERAPETRGERDERAFGRAVARSLVDLREQPADRGRLAEIGVIRGAAPVGSSAVRSTATTKEPSAARPATTARTMPPVTIAIGGRGEVRPCCPP